MGNVMTWVTGSEKLLKFRMSLTEEKFDILMLDSLMLEQGYEEVQASRIMAWSSRGGF